MKLPDEVQEFLRSSGIDPHIFTVPIPRYIRINPYNPISISDLTDQLIAKNPGIELGIKEVEWLDGFYEMNREVKIAYIDAYKEGKIYGMDASSAVPVITLDPRPGERVLDLCCAPGVKLIYISERMNGQGEILGVDISNNRLNVCRSIIAKYYPPTPIQLIQSDGTSFTSDLFDKILVDAECTHEGSIKHLEKFEKQWGWDSFKRRVIDTHTDLQTLQRSLLLNACNLLKPGGSIVYSTCSFNSSQNEQIIDYILSHRPDMQKIEISTSMPCRQLEGYIKFDPVISKTGGQFVGLLRKML